MSIYLRTYKDFSYELIFTEGKFKKSKKHILINPSIDVKLPQLDQDIEAEINPLSLTHLVSMTSSVVDNQMLKRTVKLAETTNKPIITNQKSAQYLREFGLPIKQLRILGFQEEIIDGIRIDPVYKEEITAEEEQNIQNEKEKEDNPILDIGKKVGKFLNPRNLIKNIIPSAKKPIMIDVTNPLAILISLNKNQSILLPIDKRGVTSIAKICTSLKPWLVVLTNQTIDHTYKIKDVHNVIFLEKDYQAEEMLAIPRSSNPGLDHNTYHGGFDRWYEIPS